VIFSAHGVSQQVRRDAQARGLTVFDATCPLVTKVHVEVTRMHDQGREIIMIGHRGHPEVEGTMGQFVGGIHLVETAADVQRLRVADEGNLAYVTQTTLSVDDAAGIVAALRQRFPTIVGPRKDDICYATQNRQAAVKNIAGDVDVVLVIGAANSSNANRLVEVAEMVGTRAYLINDLQDIRQEWLEGARRIGVTAGASTPEVLVTEVMEALHRDGAALREVRVVDEDVRFALPQELEQLARQRGATLPSRATPRQSL
jgi:4-hydroxy-3-methylbut-2-enyl diphosphate reductase